MVTRRMWEGKATIRVILLLALHQVAGTLGVMFSAPFLTYSVVAVLQFFQHSPVTTHRVSAALTETPGFPIQAVVGLLLGAQIGYRFRQPYGQWIWILP